MHRRPAISLAVSIIVFTSVWILAATAPVQFVQSQFHDWFFSIRGEIPVSDDLILVEIDDTTRAAYRSDRVPRHQIAFLIDRLADLGAAAIGVDILFAGYSDDPVSDSTLSIVSASYPSVVHSVDLELQPLAAVMSADTLTWHAESFSRYTEGVNHSSLYAVQADNSTFPFAELWSSGALFGNISMTPDGDSVVRRTPLLIHSNATVIPALALEILRVYVGGRSGKISASDDQLDIWGGRDSLSILLDDNGRIWINYTDSGSRFRRFSFIDLLRIFDSQETDVLAQARTIFADKVVLIGGTSTRADFDDLQRTPHGRSEPGLYIHANIISSVTTRQALSVVSRNVIWTIAIALVLALTVAFVSPSVTVRTVVLFLVPPVYVIAAYQLFTRSGLILPMVAPVTGWILGAVAIASLNALRRRRTIGLLTARTPGGFQDFDLLLEKSEPGYRARVLDSPAGEPTGEFQLPLSGDDLKQLQWKLNPRRLAQELAAGTGSETIRDQIRVEIKQIGAMLLQSALAGEVRAVLQSSLDEARRTGTGLRLRLRFDDVPELQMLPWETLYNPERDQFLALSSQTPLVRHIPQPGIVQPLEIDLPLRVLVVISAPESFQFDVQAEWRAIETGLAALDRADLISMRHIESTTPDSLQRTLLDDECHVLHFIGHGTFDELTGQGSLILADDAQKPRMLTGESLGRLLRDNPSLRIVVLNACEGAVSSSTDAFSGVAQSVVRAGLPAVVGMQLEIGHDDAVVFASTLYRLLAHGRSLDVAVSEARKAMYDQGAGAAWVAPVLYMRSRDGRVFSVG